MSGLGIALAASIVACGGSKEPASAPAESASGGAAAGAKVDMATVGEIEGVVTFEGSAPKNEPIQMNADPACMKASTTPQFQETYMIGSDGKSLGNVFVYVKDGLGNYVYDPPAGSVTLDQKNCRYIPHVFGVRVGQKVEILNSDATLHNIHAQPRQNDEFNNGQPLQGMKLEHTFTTTEVMVPFKCDVHGWMNAYVGVLDHPYFAVSDSNGKFELESLPPGTYTIEAWHEKLGRATQTVTLGPKEEKKISFTFKPAATATD